MTQRILVILVLVASTTAMGRAWAEEAPEKDKPTAAVTLVEFAEVMTAAGCRADAVSDPRFVADAKNAMRPLIHSEDANAMLTNKKHVVYSYAALLVLFVGFIMFLFGRQRRLAAQLEQLEDELKRALEADAK